MWRGCPNFDPANVTPQPEIARTKSGYAESAHNTYLSVASWTWSEFSSGPGAPQAPPLAEASLSGSFVPKAREVLGQHLLQPLSSFFRHALSLIHI